MSTLHWIYHFKIAEAVPLDRAVTFAEIAKARGVDEDYLKRILRYAMTNRIFREPEAGLVAHTSVSALLVRSKSLNDWVGYTCEETYPSSAKLVEAYEKYGASQKPNEAAYSVAFNTDKPMFVHLAEFPERERRFANTMIEMTSTDGYGVHHLVNGYKWEDIGKATVVDVSPGMLLRTSKMSNIVDSNYYCFLYIGWWFNGPCMHCHCGKEGTRCNLYYSRSANGGGAREESASGRTQTTLFVPGT